MLNDPLYSDPDARTDLFDTVRVVKARSHDLVELLVPPAARESVEFEPPEPLPEITGGTPVRWLAQPSKGTTKSYFWSRKNGQTILCESLSEKFASCLCEADPWVSAFFPQPLQIEYPWYRGPRLYTPDLFIWRDGKPYIVEIKWAEKLVDPEFREVIEFLAAYFTHRHITYQVWTERFIHAPPRLRNAQLLVRHRRTPVARQQRLLALEYLDERGHATIAELADIVGGQEPRHTVLALILRGWLAIDMNQPLTDASVVRRFAGAAR